MALRHKACFNWHLLAEGGADSSRGAEGTQALVMIHTRYTGAWAGTCMRPETDKWHWSRPR